MSYKIIHESDTVHIVQPRHWWSDVSLKDFVAALKELSGRVVTIQRFRDWNCKFVVITEEK